MADILTDKFVKKLSKQFDLMITTAEELGIYLGYTKADGAAAAIQANVERKPQSAFGQLLTMYATDHGRDSESALNLRKIFLREELVFHANFIRDELERLNIPFLSNEDTLIEMNNDVSLPSLPRGTPGEVAEAAGGTQTGAKTGEASKDPAYKPDEVTDEKMEI